MGQEQRKHTRRSFSEDERFLIEYKKTTGLFNRWQLALTRNLSASGLLFRSEELLHINTFLKIRVSIPSLKKPILANAKVVRIDSTKRSDLFDIALFFLEIDPSQQKLLDQFCKDQEEKHRNDPNKQIF